MIGRAISIGIVLAGLTIGGAALAQQVYPCQTSLMSPRDQQRAGQNTMSYTILDTEAGRVLLLEGVVGANESARLASQLRSIMAQPGGIFEVWFNSPGGMAIEGPRMGRVLRQLGVPTRVRRGHMCVSACSYAFLGGIIRTTEAGSFYGLHMFSGAKAHLQSLANSSNLLNDIQDIEQNSALTAAERYEYLLEMGISVRVARHALSIDHDTASCPPRRVLQEWNVDNGG